MGKPPTFFNARDRLGIDFSKKLPQFFKSEPGLDRIVFKAGPYRFTSKAWREQIPRLISSGTVKVALSDAMPQGVAAQYAPANKTLRFARAFSLHNIWEKQIALHECAHILVDETRYPGAQSSWLDESAAYIAEMCFALLKGGSMGGAIRAAAVPVARKIIASPISYLVTADDARPIRKALGMSTIRSYRNPSIWRG